MSVVEGGLRSSFLIITFILLPAGDVKRSDTAKTSNFLGQCRRHPGKGHFPAQLRAASQGPSFCIPLRILCGRGGRVLGDGMGHVPLAPKGGYAAGKVFDPKGLLDWLNVSIR